jgi:hypothetical protein
MTQPVGRKLPLSPSRRFICDLMRAGAGVPTITVERRLRIPAVLEARQIACPRPSWCAVFTKAYAHVAAARPELRRAYLPFPWPHLYEHPLNVAAVAVERHLDEEDAVFFAHLRAPENQGLVDLDAALRHYKEAPLHSVGLYRRVLRVGRLPRPLRRLLWGAALHLSGRRRARVLGTFGVSAVGHLGAGTLNLVSPLTTNLTYGPIADNGSVEVRVMFDHRALDAAPVARALEHLERVLNGEIVAELGYLQSLDEPLAA